MNNCNEINNNENINFINKRKNNNSNVDNYLYRTEFKIS